MEILAGKQLFGIFIGDIITCACGLCDWDGAYVLVMDINTEEQKILGIEFDGVQIDYDVEHTISSRAEKCVVVKRNMMLHSLDTYVPADTARFSEGDEVIVLRGEGEGFHGNIVHLHPSQNLLNPYIVELFGYLPGGKRQPSWMNSDMSKTLISTCVWKEARDLMLVKDFENFIFTGKNTDQPVQRILSRE